MKNILVSIVISLSGLIVFAADTKKVDAVNAEAVKVDVLVTEKGFEPSTIIVKPGSNVTLNITRKTDVTCATQVVVPSKKIKKDLPLNKMVSVDVGTVKKGEIAFGCGMNMMVGARILVN